MVIIIVVQHSSCSSLCADCWSHYPLFHSSQYIEIDLSRLFYDQPNELVSSLASHYRPLSPLPCLMGRSRRTSWDEFRSFSAQNHTTALTGTAAAFPFGSQRINKKCVAMACSAGLEAKKWPYSRVCNALQHKYLTFSAWEIENPKNLEICVAYRCKP